MNKNNISLIVLAGGKSERMGLPKVWISLLDGISFAEQVFYCYNNSIKLSKNILVLNSTFNQKKETNALLKKFNFVSIVLNYYPEKGRLYSIKCGIDNVTTDYTFIHNIDQPHIDSKTLNLMIDNKGSDAVVIPRYKGRGGHPVLIGKQIIDEIKQHYTKYNTLKDVFANFSNKYVDVSTPDVLTNINTPEELTLFQKL